MAETGWTPRVARGLSRQARGVLALSRLAGLSLLRVFSLGAWRSTDEVSKALQDHTA